MFSMLISRTTYHKCRMFASSRLNNFDCRVTIQQPSSRNDMQSHPGSASDRPATLTFDLSVSSGSVHAEIVP